MIHLDILSQVTVLLPSQSSAQRGLEDSFQIHIVCFYFACPHKHGALTANVTTATGLCFLSKQGTCQQRWLHS
jgi:hypothetical protein